jgi:hypothetical protein
MIIVALRRSRLARELNHFEGRILHLQHP